MARCTKSHPAWECTVHCSTVACLPFMCLLNNACTSALWHACLSCVSLTMLALQHRGMLAFHVSP
eukprot:1161564-Pelagomonas_calceolata.AAC.14